MMKDAQMIVVEEGGVVTLPTDFLADLGWQAGDDLAIKVVENGFTIERADPNAR